MSYLIDRAEEAQKRKLDFAREQADRAAVASGNVDENSALYRHAKLNGWAIGQNADPFHGQAGRKWYAAEQASKGRILDARADMAEDDALRAGFDDIMARANAQKADRARRGRATLGYIVGNAMDNGGMVSPALAPSVGMELGQPGFVGGTLTKDGTFMSLGRGKNGSIQPTGLVSPLDVEKAMVASGDYRNAMKFYNRFLNGKYTPEQIKSASGFSKEWVKQTVDKEQQRRAEVIEGVLIDGIKSIMKERPEATPAYAWRALLKNNPGALSAYLTRPAREGEENDINGNVTVDPTEGFEKFKNLWDAANSGDAQSVASGDPKMDQIGMLLDRLERMNAPAAKDPNTVAMEQRAARRANVIDAAGGRQSLVIRRDPDGRETWTNGYVVDGKVYDVNGDERQGEFYDERGNPIKPTAPVASAVGDMANGVAGLNNGGQAAPEQRANDAAALLAARGKGGANATTQTAQTNATQANATNATNANINRRRDPQTDGDWSWETYRWNPDAKGGSEIDPSNIKGTGRSFNEADRAVLPAEKRKAFEAWMDELAEPKNEWETDDGKKVKVSSHLVPKNWRTDKKYNRDYDFVRAFLLTENDPELRKSMVGPLYHKEDGKYWLHMNDIGKLPTHPTFSTDSYYAQDPHYSDLAGTWKGESYIPGKAERAVQTNADEEERRRRQDMHRRWNIQAAGATDEIADYYDSIPKEDMQKFRNMLGEDVSTADLYAGKYDQGLRNFAELEGNESIPVELDQIAWLRSKKQVTDRGNAIADVTQGRQKEYDDGMAKIRAEAAKKVARGDWKKADYDEYVNRQEFMLSERLRKKYNAIQTAMQ